MSEYAHDESNSQRYAIDANLQNSLDDSANNSIIGKVKSKVSSILPNRLSKWFSPSAKLQNDSLNGSLYDANNTVPTRRRRRIDVEEEEENYVDDRDEQRYGEYEESHHLYPMQVQNRGRNVDVVDENDDDDDSQNSEEDYNDCSIKQSRRELNVERQPPAKRSRLNIEVRDSPIATTHPPLLSSTPAASSSHLRNAAISASAPRSTYQRYTHLNLYGNQNKREPAFNFGHEKELKSMTKTNTDIIDLITSSYDKDDKLTEFSCRRAEMGSRKSLNIPSASPLTVAERIYSTGSTHFKRQPLSTAKPESSTTNNTIGVSARRTSTTINEVEEQVVGDSEDKRYDGIEKDNGNVAGFKNVGSNKRQKLINGTGINTAITIQEATEGILVDSASDSGDSAMDAIKNNTSDTQQRKTGLFNMSGGAAANTRNSSRTSSFGNGLNFYTHLEGRKSLFSGTHNVNSNPLNNSTLSLTSLNRRQFNASIYGSTSALSDSRLLNTFSPFYKGKTTYGGAAAYNKYTVGAGASTVRITPTLIRPTSSLSTLSSSSNSFSINVNSNLGENSTISSTAKRILDLINDFATPLSEAKKMASNLKTNPSLQVLPQAKGRLNENDLNASRAMRLSQVRTPYYRPAVILQPSGNASGRGASGGILPPVKELQVPTMSQLLQMKKMQNTTENVRKITQNSVENAGVMCEYTLPDVTSSKIDEHKSSEQGKQKHTNKIRNKVANSLRPAIASRGLHDEEPPPPVNLPNIAFPLMESVPKIDIQINKTLNSDKSNSICKLLSTAETLNMENIESKNTSHAFNILPTSLLKETSDATIDNKLSTSQSIKMSKSKNFTFSEPIKIDGDLPPAHTVNKNEIYKYKFSPPADVIVSDKTNTEPKQPQLKEGSCLDVLSKPFALPQILDKSSVTEKAFPKAFQNVSSDFGKQFEKSSNEWECEACMIRNKSDINKCLACETPRKHESLMLQQSTNTSASSFGEQFKISSNEWECDTCMIRNRKEATNCVACEAPHKSGGPKSDTTTSPAIKNSFGDAFKPKPGTWECQTCMVSNKSELNECIACQTKKSGFENATTSGSSQLKADAGFKTLAAKQNASKWECDACMTRNDANRTKCACCEQPKSGTTTVDTSTSIKFQFGATAASKFSFGFGTSENNPKEEDLRKKLSDKSVKQNSPDLGKTGVVSPGLGGFQFGIKTATSSISECKKDETDSNKQITGFKFAVPASTDESKINKSSATITSPKGFVFGSNPSTLTLTTSTPTLSSAAVTSSASVKFSLPSKTISSNNCNSDKPAAVPAFTFGANAASSTTGGFSLGNKSATKNVSDAIEVKTASDTINFKAPATIKPTNNSDFVFGSSTTNRNSLTSSSSGIPFVSSSLNTTTSTAPTTTAVATATVKPMFSFGTNALTTPAQNSQSVPAFSSFSFGSKSSSNTAVTTTANTSNTLFAAVTSTSAVTTTTSATIKTSSLSSSSTTTTTPASTNIFSSFSGSTSSSNASAAPIFGSSINPPANNLSTVSSSTNNPEHSNTSQFGAFGSKKSLPVFGSFGGASGVEAKSSVLVKPSGTKSILPVFGNVASSSTSQSSQSNASCFVFGSSPADDTTVVTTASTVASVTSTSTTWPKNSFIFGSTPATSSNAVSPGNENDHKDIAKSSVFGAFGSCSTNAANQQQTSPIFGGQSTNIGETLSVSGTTTLRPTNSGTNLFGTTPTSTVTSIFGANSSGNAVTPASAFGLSPFGGPTSSTSATPTFGSIAASGTTFGTFGSSSSNIKTNTTEVKKSEAAFSFGTAATTQSTSGGFNFGSSASTTKPTFNFGGTTTTQQPTFNFTGITETQSSTKPFQFGATPSAPVFNFNRGVLEGTPNAPFQFNAGAAPVSSNIFAPAPTPGTQTAQQAKRKIRAPIRRVTQR